MNFHYRNVLSREGALRLRRRARAHGEENERPELGIYRRDGVRNTLSAWAAIDRRETDMYTSFARALSEARSYQRMCPRSWRMAHKSRRMVGTWKGSPLARAEWACRHHRSSTWILPPGLGGLIASGGARRFRGLAYLLRERNLRPTKTLFRAFLALTGIWTRGGPQKPPSTSEIGPGPGK